MNLNKLQEMASEKGIKASVKKLGGMILANINGQSFKVKSEEQFAEKLEELKDYEAPAPVDLTSRLERIEQATIELYK